MSSCSIINPDLSYCDKIHSEHLTQDKRLNSNPQLPTDILLKGIEKFFPETYQNIFSPDPKIVYKSLSNFPILFYSNLPNSLPTVEIVNKFLELATSSKFKEISCQAAIDLYIMYAKFPQIREYLMQNQFYIYLFNHLNRNISMNFVDAVSVNPAILQELDNINAVEAVVNHILNWENIPLNEPIPVDTFFPPINRLSVVEVTPEQVLISNIKIFKEFLDHEIENAIKSVGGLTEFLSKYVFIKDGEIKNEVIDFLISAVPYTHQFLEEKGIFSFVVKNCVDETVFKSIELITSLKFLAKSASFCCDHLISEGIISTIHAVFSGKDENDFQNKLAIDICTSIALNGPEKIILLISEPGVGLHDDLCHYAHFGSYPQKKSFINFFNVLVKHAEVPEISNFLASISAVQLMADFLESNVQPIFIDILQSLIFLVNLKINNALTENLSNHLVSVLKESTILISIENFFMSNELSDYKNKDVANEIIKLSNSLHQLYSKNFDNS